MTADYSDLLRLILDLIRFGTIADIDYHDQRGLHKLANDEHWQATGATFATN